MGKPIYIYTDSETEESSCSSIENLKKKKRFSLASTILRRTTGSAKKRKCKKHSKSEPEDSDYRSRSRSNPRVRYKLPGILKKCKYDKDKESSDEEDSEPFKPPRFHDKYLVGRVPRPPGANPGRGAGVAIIVKKNVSKIQGQQSTPTTKTKKSSQRRLSKKRSY